MAGPRRKRRHGAPKNVDRLSRNQEYKPYLTVCAPIVTVAISGLWLFVKSVYIDPFTARKAHESTHNYIIALLADAKRYEADVLADPKSTVRHKEEVRKQVERLEIALMQAITARVDLIEIRA